MKRNLLTLSLLLAILPVSASDFPGTFSGEITAEYRYFNQAGEYGNEDRHNMSVVLIPEYSYSWDNDRSVVSIIPFARLDQNDDERSHLDIRELSLVQSWSQLELRLGISKVFWGVTESQHLVDVVNQTDYVENPDGEQKLGQPMLNPTLVTSVGNVGVFILPWFRERTFAGSDGRYRGPVIVDTENSEYTHNDAEHHIDYALRWSANWEELDWAVSYFRGTDRDPVLRLDNINNVLIPVYGQSKQWGLELQYIYKDLLAKAEFIRKESDLYERYSAAVIGFEYTFTNISDGMDIGVLYEWLYDSRDQSSPSGLYDASFLGTRIALNDEASTQMLIGAIYDNHTSDINLFRVEASRRLNNTTSIGLEINVIGQPNENSLLYQFRADDYLQITLSGYL